MLRFAITQGKSLGTVYDYLKEFPIMGIAAAEKQPNLLYNSVLKALLFLQEAGSITQEANTARNRVWKYTALGFIYKGL